MRSKDLNSGEPSYQSHSYLDPFKMIFHLTNACIALLFTVTLTLTIATPLVTAAPQTTETTPQATDGQDLNQLIKTATQTQKNGNFELAASQWQAVWEQFPNSEFSSSARFQAGFCHQQLRNYPRAIENLKAAIPKFAASNEQLPTAKLYLGYCQFQLGQRNLKTATNATQRKQAADLVTTAVIALQRLLQTYPNFPDAFQAYYFLGGAFEELDRKQEAIDAYQKMATVPNPNDTFKYESTFAIADLNFELGRYGQAKEYFDKLIADPDTKQRPDGNLVVYSAAQTLIALGAAAKQNGTDQESKQSFADAERLLKTIVKPTSNDAPSISLAREAERRLAFCYRQQNRFQSAGDTYAAVYQKFDERASTAIKIEIATDAGLSYLDAGDREQGEAFLKLATKTTSPISAKSAHLLSAFYLEQQRFDNAYDLSTRFIPVAQPPNLMPLKLNQANAAIEIDGKFDQAIVMFNSIADNFPDHELAPVALRNAASGQVRASQYAAAINTADNFIKRYPAHDRLPEILEVKGNALSLSGQYSNAEKIFQQLINDQNLTENPNRSNWILAGAQAKFEQENFAGTITDLQASIKSITNPNKVAQALYLVGVSHFQLQQYKPAMENLTAFFTVENQSGLADRAQLYLGLSLLEQDRYKIAKQTIDRLAADSPNSPLLNQAYVQLGNERYQADQQAEAIAWFQKVIDSTQATPVEKASAIHGAAWAHLKSDNRDAAKPLFKQIIQAYPKSEFLTSAKAGLASIDPSLVQSPAEDPSQTDEPRDNTNSESLRKTGLAQVKAEQWAAAINSFEKLLKATPNNLLVDADLYELAWAHRSLKQEAQALKYFGKIAADHPTSRFATEANFHVGKAAYDGHRYDAAIEAFGACVGTNQDSANPTVREKAAYKLAWAYYKQDKFSQAHSAFVRQTELFPNGDLLADGKFMAAESLFRNRQFGPALVAYKAAKPIVSLPTTSDKKLKWLTLLHGAQCANQQQDYQATIEWARDIIEPTEVESEGESPLKQDILLEIGKAYDGLKDTSNAMKFWRLASSSLSKTGAEASCLIGRQLRVEKKYDAAEREFKKVFFGFGGKESKPAIRPWQAYARYEAGRSNHIRAQTSTDAKTKQAYLKIAMKHFQALVDDYPNDKLTIKAQKELKTLSSDSDG